MTKKERAALALERKILRAIETGEFTPAHGYLRNQFYKGSYGDGPTVIGPCGCAIAAAASVNGFDIDERGPAGMDVLRAYLETVGLSLGDSSALENGYEDDFEQRPTNPYYLVGKRLSRFHPKQDGMVEV